MEEIYVNIFFDKTQLLQVKADAASMKKSGIFSFSSISVILIFERFVYFRWKSSKSEGHYNLGQTIFLKFILNIR